VTDVLEKDAAKLAERAQLGKDGTSVYTPFASAVFERQRKDSTG